MMKHSPMRVSG